MFPPRRAGVVGRRTPLSATAPGVVATTGDAAAGRRQARLDRAASGALIELLWLLFLVPLLVGLVVQRRLRSVFARYRAVANRAGVTGAQLARALLDAHGLGQVRVEQAPGFLSDHYDGSAQRLRLSDVVARERSVASLGIAAHEVSHAYQDAEGSRVYRARRAVGEPLSKLPVELSASRRALTLLRGGGFTDAEETGEVEQVLHAAALTYVVGLLQQLGLLFALVLIAEATRRLAT